MTSSDTTVRIYQQVLLLAQTFLRNLTNMN